MKRFWISLICGVLSALILFSSGALTSFAATDSEDAPLSSSASLSGGENADEDSGTVPQRIQAAYSFDDGDSLTDDAAGGFPLSSKEFGASMIESVAGKFKGGMKGYIHMNASLFSTFSQLSVGFWTNVSKAEAEGASTVFVAEGKGKGSIELRYSAEGEKLILQLYFRDGYNMALCTYDMSQVLSDDAQWVHVAFTYRISGTVSLLTLYVNGKSTATSISTAYVDLSRFQCDTAAFHGIRMDELYYTDITLAPGKIATLINRSAADFLAAEQKEAAGEEETPDNIPEILPESYAYNWAAYLFDGTFAIGTDYHSGDIPATPDASCILIDSSKLKEKYGYAMIRRENSVPSSYLTLDSRLFYGHQAFTFACWVYRNGTTLACDEILLDLKGNGIFRFAPYASADGSTLSAYVEYTDTRGNEHHQSLEGAVKVNPCQQWVHYAVTVTETGSITVYVNGASVGSFSSGVNPGVLAFNQCKVLTGASAYQSVRTAIDEVYVTPKALTDADIRKIHAYGLEQYTSRVLPDPGQTGTEEDTSNPYAPDSVDLAEDAYSESASVSGGFVGTTFDNRANVGLDWNNGANATVTGGRLTQGVFSYGLALDGNSFVRYPMGFLDNATGLTVSLSYSWEGPGADGTRSQRLFDFSRKTSSVTDPTAFMFLEMGNGISGLRFGISDGVSSTYLPCDYSAVNTWTRVTVTVSDGKITLYLDDKAVATGDTTVDLSAICPNFCYVGRSGVKGDPMFTGTVDEIYIAPAALSADEVGAFVSGLTPALKGDLGGGADVWTVILTVIIIVAVVLVLAVIAVIVVIITKKEKKTSEDEAPLPVSITGMEGDGTTVIGSRIARRSAGMGGDDGSTMKFRKVTDENPPVPSGEATAKFRKITDDSGDDK